MAPTRRDAASRRFSLARAYAIALKEFVQMRRDRLTFAMIVGIPIAQVLLFGFVINTDPKALPTAVVDYDRSEFTRSIVQSLANTGYFDIVPAAPGVRAADEMLARGDIQFAVVFPAGFSRELLRGERPSVMVAADATDPSATGNALAALAQTGTMALTHDLTGSLARLAPGPAPFSLDVQRRYNPEGITQYNIVPGLLAVILQMTMVMMTAFAITRERERGTYEGLLATPVLPLELMSGKIAPYIVVGIIQSALILAAAKLLFGVPMVGSLGLLGLTMMLYIAALLGLGYAISTLAANQLQAMQMTFFFFLPTMLLSGFMFPFRGMPQWAQWLGEAFPATHFLRIVRGVLLKGNGLDQVAPHTWPIAVFMVAVVALARWRYRQTLD
ncbi:MAG TPA: ABC transporter permease [Casimicrobiaceae bacterium]|jgi:ABC-2 type transport system permease protein|nr:ABC transporter permease [Casimicrobiaceae bacterium]